MHKGNCLNAESSHGQNDLLKCFLVSLKAFKDKLVMFHAISKHLKRITRVKLVRFYTVTLCLSMLDEILVTCSICY